MSGKGTILGRIFGKVATTSLIEREFYDRLEGVRSGNLCNKVLQAGCDCDCLEECKYSKDSGLSVQSVNLILVFYRRHCQKIKLGSYYHFSRKI
jgi:hypothetical protein